MMKHGTKKRSLFRLKWILAGLAALVVLLGVSLAREMLRSRQIDREIDQLKSESEFLRAKNFEIANLTASLDDEEFLEREARTKLGLKKAGEDVIVLKKDGASSGIRRVVGVDAETAEDWTTAKRWWMYFADRSRYDDYALRHGYR